jgi:hypothetical protein
MRDSSEVIHLSTDDESERVIYSADLSKSTDPISIELARFVLDCIVSHTGKPEWWDNAVQAVINEHTLPSGEVTKCGALMGLGPSWTILSILNSFAADEAGGEQTDHRTCGDDLVGLWRISTCTRYERAIASLHLKSNTEKSYRGTNGVFCERFVTKDGSSARIESHVRIGQAVGSRSKSNQRGHLAIDSLAKARGTKAIRSAIRRNLYSNSPRRNMPGLIRHGGGGVRDADAITVIGYLQGGGAATNHHESSATYKNLRKELSTLPATVTGVRVRDVLNLALSQEELAYRTKNGAATRATAPVKLGELRRSLIRNRTKAKKLVNESRGPIAALKACLGTNSLYYRIGSTKSKSIIHKLRGKRFNAALNAIHNTWDELISVEDAKRVFQQSYPSTIPSLDMRLSPAKELWDSSPQTEV